MQDNRNQEDPILVTKAEKIMKTSNLYEILGIQISASEKEIKKAYRKVNKLIKKS